MNRLYRLHARRKQEGKAFTLLELIVVLLVLGVLAAIAVPTYNTLKTNSVDRSVNTTLDAIARAGEAAHISDPQMTDEQTAIASLDGLTADDDAGTPGYQQGDRTISRDGSEVTVSLSSGTIDRSGTVSFADGISSVNYAGAAPGGGGGGPAAADRTGILAAMHTRGYPMSPTDPARNCCVGSTTTDGNFGIIDVTGGSSLRFITSVDYDAAAGWNPGDNDTEVLTFTEGREAVVLTLAEDMHADGFNWNHNNNTHIFFKCTDPAEHAAATYPSGCTSGGDVYTLQVWAGSWGVFGTIQALFS